MLEPVCTGEGNYEDTFTVQIIMMPQKSNFCILIQNMYIFKYSRKKNETEEKIIL